MSRVCPWRATFKARVVADANPAAVAPAEHRRRVRAHADANHTEAGAARIHLSGAARLPKHAYPSHKHTHTLCQLTTGLPRHASAHALLKIAQELDQLSVLLKKRATLTQAHAGQRPSTSHGAGT